MAKNKKFIHHEYPTEGRSREDEVLANRKLGDKRIPTPIVEGTGKKQGGSSSHRGQDEAESIIYELTGGDGVVPPDMADDAQAAAQMLTISQRNARKWKSLRKQVELLKEGFTYEKDHDPEKHVKVETKERDQTGTVDGTGKEVETAMSEEEPLEELTDGELTEVEKKPTQETFPTEEEIREEKHEAAKKKKKEVWDKARRDGIGTRWVNSSNVTKWTPQDPKSIKDRGSDIESSATNVEGETLEEAQEKRRAARKRKPAGGKRKKLQQELQNLNLSIKSLQEINKLASSDPERVQQTGRSVRTRRRSGEIPSWKRQYPIGGIESDKKTKPAKGAPIGVNPSEQTPEKPTGKTTVVREGTEKPKGKFAKVREALGGLKDRITNRKQEIETGKPPVEQAETKRGRPASTPKTGRRPAGTTPRSRGGKGKKQPTTTTTSATPETDKLAQQTGSLKETIENYKQQVGVDDEPTMFKKRQKIRGSQS